mmetsp:Transcript_135111/g.431341  ORF Transcript_135111/g.431341 Transcript_135111/m.431341 type:complete len:1016 (-) Transcript_135111:93-3140(-)
MRGGDLGVPAGSAGPAFAALIDDMRHGWGELPWILCADINDDVRDSPFAAGLVEQGGARLCEGFHLRGRHPIDGIWAANGLEFDSHTAVLDGMSDHSLLQAEVALASDKRVQEFRLAARARLVDEPGACTEQELKDLWEQEAETHDLEGACGRASAEAAWRAWSSAAAACLTRAGRIEGGELDLGVTAEPRQAGHRRGQGQTLGERQARRRMRRIMEAALIVQRSGHVPGGLLTSIRRDIIEQQGPEEQLDRGEWGGIKAWATEQLKKVLDEIRKDRINRWKARLRTPREAFRWLKAEAPAPWAARDPDTDELAVGRAGSARLLQRWWGALLRKEADDTPEVKEANFYEVYGDLLERHAELDLLPIYAEDLYRIAEKDVAKAMGPFGWSYNILLQLPPDAWESLARVLGIIEKCGAWPESLTHWRIAFIPKVSGVSAAAARADKVRPIAIGSCIYRMWSKLRCQQLAHHVVPRFKLNQAGAARIHDAATLAVEIAMEADLKGYEFGCSLDFLKAFDSVEPLLAVTRMREWGLPKQVCDLLYDQWRRQVRWASIGGAVCEEPIRGARALPQGDAFAPMALAAMLGVPHQRAMVRVPQSVQALYLDDRTVATNTLHDIAVFRGVWGEFSGITGLRDNGGKTQIWGFTDDAEEKVHREVHEDHSKDYGEVLGATLGKPGRRRSDAETKREEESLRLARRLARFPGTMKTRRAIAAASITAKAVWGTIYTGRVPQADEARRFNLSMRAAIHGREGACGRHARELERALLWGPQTDLTAIAVLRACAILARWVRLRRFFGMEVPADGDGDSHMVAGITRVLSNWGWRRVAWGHWRGLDGEFIAKCATPPSATEKGLHEMRDGWRRHSFCTWLRSPRRDSRLAVAQGIVFDLRLAKTLRDLAKGLDEYARAVMVGGMTTDATRNPVPTRCEDCDCDVVPSIEHVLWHCTAFDDLRRVPAPAFALARRLGWTKVGHRDMVNKEQVKKRLIQMGWIREASAKARASRGGWRERKWLAAAADGE